MNRVQQITMTAAVAATVTLAGCSSQGPTRPATPAEMQASLPALRSNFQANFPQASAIAHSDLAVSAEVSADSFRTRDASKRDFVR